MGTLILRGCWWAVVATALLGTAGPGLAAEKASPKDTLVVLWTSGDPEVAHRVCLMYTHAAKRNRWFEHVILVVWGPSSRLLAGDKDLQAKVKQMIADGVEVKACVVCTDSYGVSDRLRQLGIEVKGMGKPLTEYLKAGYAVLTF